MCWTPHLRILNCTAQLLPCVRRVLAMRDAGREEADFRTRNRTRLCITVLRSAAAVARKICTAKLQAIVTSSIWRNSLSWRDCFFDCELLQVTVSNFGTESPEQTSPRQVSHIRRATFPKCHGVSDDPGTGRISNKWPQPYYLWSTATFRNEFSLGVSQNW